MHIKSTSQLATVAIGIILFLGALFTLLALLKYITILINPIRTIGYFEAS